MMQTFKGGSLRKHTPEPFLIPTFVQDWNEPLYQAFKAAVATYGRDEIFQVFSTRRTYRYLYLGGYRYWICEDVVNRVEIDKISWDEQGWSYQLKAKND
jgi:hypothetical protein